MAEGAQVIVEFIPDTSQLASIEEKLVALGKIDAQSASFFKQTNDQIKQRNTLLGDTEQDQEKINVQAKQQQAIYQKLTASLKDLSTQGKQAVTNLILMTQGNVAKYFNDAGISVEDYVGTLEAAGQASDDTNKKTATVRQQLKSLVNQLAELTVAGETETEQFKKLSLQAGVLRNALDDTQTTVNNLGQDVPILKLFGTAVQGITAGFTLATGAAALFGSENEELQAVLVKVNAVMAINAGITELINILNDEATISTAKAIAAQTVRNATIAIENGLQSESVIVRTAATVAQYALNLAMSLNPIGLLVVGLAAFVTGIVIYTNKTIAATKATEQLNEAFDNADHLLNAFIDGTNRHFDLVVSNLEKVNARQSEINAEQLTALQRNNKERLTQLQNLNKSIEENQNSSNEKILEDVKKNRELAAKVEDDYLNTVVEIEKKKNEQLKQLDVERMEDEAAVIQGNLSLAVKNSNAEFALQRKLAVSESAIAIQAAGDDAQKVFAIRADLAKKISDINIAQAAVAQDAIAASNEDALINAQNRSQAVNDRVTQEEIDIQKAGILEVADFQAKQEGLTAQRRQQIRDAANQKALQLQRDFDQQQTIIALQSEESRNNVVLSQIKTSNEDRLALTIQNINLAAAEEIAQNRGKVEKIKEIEAKRDSDIKAVRLQSIKDTLQYELDLEEAQSAAIVRRIEAELAAQDQINTAQGAGGAAAAAKALGIQQLTLNEQIGRINKLTEINLEADKKQLDSLNATYDAGLISDQTYTLELTKLKDKETQDWENGEKRKRDATNKTAALAKQRNQEIFKDSLDAASQGIGILSSLYQQESQAAIDSISAQKQAVQDAQDAGEISAKEASARNKKLDQEQRKLQIQQAKRQKELDLFQAILNTALAVTNALTTGDPYTAPFRAVLAGALGTAQIAVIARRPLPQFGKGKKDAYTGYAEVGETGPELIKRGSRFEMAEKSTITWLAPSDIVYNPKETAAMMAARVPTNYYPGNAGGSPKTQEFDYDKFGKAVGDNIPQQGIGFDIDGFHQWTKSRGNFTKTLATRRRWIK